VVFFLNEKVNISEARGAAATSKITSRSHSATQPQPKAKAFQPRINANEHEWVVVSQKSSQASKILAVSNYGEKF
jgi:hypothetical protein